MTPRPQIVLLVPGTWRSRETIARAIADRTTGRYRLESGFLETPENEHFSIDIGNYNPRLVDVFEEGFAGELPEELHTLIDGHSFTLSLTAPTGDYEQVRRVMAAGQALLDAGGYALLVLSSGIAHTREAWEDLIGSDAPDCFIDAFVQALEKDNDTYVSVGMQNLGLPDAVLEGETDPRIAGLLIGRFLRYLVENRPDFKEGEFFQFEEIEDPFRLSLLRESEFPAGEYFHNPLGYWQLQRAEIN